jgi:hypothetical protein
MRTVRHGRWLGIMPVVGRQDRHEAGGAMQADIARYNAALDPPHREVCERLAREIDAGLEGAASKVWHGHPVWFLDDNPIVGYSLQTQGIRLMFWSGQDFGEPGLDVHGGRFRDASVFFQGTADVDAAALRRWLGKARDIQWDYRHLARRKGRLERLR